MQITLIIASLFLCLAAASTGAPDDWPTLRHDASNTGYSSSNISVPLRLAWRVKTGGGSIILASGGTICVGNENAVSDLTPKNALVAPSGAIIRNWTDGWPLYLKGDRLIVLRNARPKSSISCMRWSDSHVIWSRRLAKTGEPVLPIWSGAVTNGRLFWAENAGQDTIETSVRSIGIAGGEDFKESKLVEGWGEGGPSCDGKYLYLGASHWLHAFDTTTLAPQWAIYDGGNALPMVYGSSLIVQGWTHGVRATDLASKEDMWGMRAWRGAAHCLAEPYPGRKILIEQATEPWALTGLEPKSGKVIWRQWHVTTDNPCAGAGRHVFVAGQRPGKNGKPPPEGGFFAIDSRNGQVVWSYTKKELVGRAVIVNDGAVYGLDDAGFLYKFDSSRIGGQLRKRS
jgi:hypothetical protein